MRRLVLIALAAGLLPVAAHAGDIRGIYNYERPISGLDPALPCSQLKGYIQHVKMDLSIIRSNRTIVGGGPINTDTSAAHSGDNWSDVHNADGSTSNGAGYYATDYRGPSRDPDEAVEDNARLSLDYLNGLKSTCTADS